MIEETYSYWVHVKSTAERLIENLNGIKNVGIVSYFGLGQLVTNSFVDSYAQELNELFNRNISIMVDDFIEEIRQISNKMYDLTLQAEDNASIFESRRDEFDASAFEVRDLARHVIEMFEATKVEWDALATSRARFSSNTDQSVLRDITQKACQQLDDLWAVSATRLLLT